MPLPRVAAVIALAALTSGCASPRDEAVPACPFCGDPTMLRLADGTEVVVPRMRIGESDMSVARDDNARGDAAVRSRRLLGPR